MPPCPRALPRCRPPPLRCAVVKEDPLSRALLSLSHLPLPFSSSLNPRSSITFTVAAAVPSNSPATEGAPEQLDDANLTASPYFTSPPKESTRDAVERPCRSSFPASVRPAAAVRRAPPRRPPATPTLADRGFMLWVSAPTSPASPPSFSHTVPRPHRAPPSAAATGVAGTSPATIWSVPPLPPTPLCPLLLLEQVPAPNSAPKRQIDAQHHRCPVMTSS